MDNGPNIYIINHNISKNLIDTKGQKTYYIDFKKTNKIEEILKKQEAPKVKIYDQTQIEKPTGTIIPINDHINRIGKNPFIGRQQKLGIDFINIEKLYIQHPNGVTTNSCGCHIPEGPNPSTHLANIAIMAHVFNFKVEAFLVNA